MSRYISARHAARVLNMSEQWVRKLCVAGKLPAEPDKHGEITYWKVDTHSAEFKSRLKGSYDSRPAPLQRIAAAVDVDWDDFVLAIRTNRNKLVKSPLGKRTATEYKRAMLSHYNKYGTFTPETFAQHMTEYESAALDNTETDFFEARKTLYYSARALARYFRYKGLVSDAFVEAVTDHRPQRFLPRERPQLLCDLAAVERALEKMAVRENYPEYERYLNTAIIRTLSYTGIRNEELCKIKLSDLDFDRRRVAEGNTIYIHGKGRKERVVPMPKPVELAIKAYLEHRPDNHSEYLFLNRSGGSHTVRSICVKLSTFSETFGVTVKAHGLRRAAATRLVKEKNLSVGLVSELLGHSSLAITSIYVKSNAGAVVAAVNACFD